MSSSTPLTTVGVLGHTGRVGSHLVKHLIEYHQQGKVKLVVLHRPTSNISNLPEGVETRMVDLTKDEPDKHLEAVKGLNVVMSLVSMDGLATQTPLLKALAKSDDLEAFTIAEIGSPFSDAELADPKYQMFAARFSEIESLGLMSKLAALTSGDYADYMIGYGILGASLKENWIKLYGDALKRRIPLVTAPYLGAAMAQLNLTPPSQWAGKMIHIYDHAPTGQEMVDAFSKANSGERTEVKWYTDEELDKWAEEGPLETLGALLVRHWSSGFLENAPQYIAERGGFRQVPKDVKVDSFDDLVKSYQYDLSPHVSSSSP